MTEGASEVRERGLVIGERYRLVERIDEGGGGEVWVARDERLERDVAIKLLGTGADAAFQERFALEARRAAVVQHPNVVTVFDQGQDGDDAYIVMELVRGRTLRDIVAERGALAPMEAARIVAQVADALDAAHAAGVIHCDVKPANVILDDRGTAKLTDFGVARAARGPAEHELVATARYVAPERVLGEPPTPASDVYGLGLVAYELIAGRSPFEAAGTEDLLRERLEAPPPSLRRARPEAGAEIDLVVAKAIAADPARRYQSAGAFARDLQGAVRGERTETMPVVRPALRPLRRGRDRARIVTIVALSLAALVVLGTGLVYLGSSGVRGIVAPAGTASAVVTPNVVGKDLRTAVHDLLAAGYQPVAWDFSRSPGGAAPCSVITQDPPAGSPLRAGAPASLVYVGGAGCTDGVGR